jgi:predicted metalloprotease with PDZ domain
VTGFLLAALVGAAAVASDAPIAYRLTFPGSSASRVRVEIEVPDLPSPRILVIPRAIPMGYGEAPYDRFVFSVEALDAAGKPLAVERSDGPRWRIGGPGLLRRLAYEVDLQKMERELPSASDASKVRAGYVGVLGYSVFGYLDGLEDRPARLTVRTPHEWPVFTTLAPAVPPARGGIEASAPSFYALADSQLAMGPDLRVSRVEARVPLYLLLYAEVEPDLAAMTRAAREAFEAVAEYFGSTPFPHYTMYSEILRPIDAEHRYGFSMEHLDSATFFLGASDALPTGASEADLERTRYNFAHHIAHAWIPKRCYGEGYYPFPWELAPVIDTIWFSEGFAQYAAIVALAATQSGGAQAYREKKLQGRFRSRLAEAPDFLRRMSAVELSRVASTRYSEDFRTGAGSFARGGLMAAEMDDAIGAKTGGRKSLRDALRALVAWSERERRAFRLEELPGLLRQGTGVDVRETYERWLAAPEPAAGPSSSNRIRPQ